MVGPGKGVGGGPRGVVREWSHDSKRRLLKTAGAINWGEVTRGIGGRFEMHTLTYAEDPGPEKARAHLQAYGAAWRRRAGRLVGVWKREFQARGVVHYHVLLWSPGTNRRSLAADRRWSWSTWGRITGARSRVDVDYMRARQFARYFVAYASGSKGYQHEVPESWERPGRWWGVWGTRPEWSEVAVRSREDFFRVRRVLYRVRQRRVRWQLHPSRGMFGTWVLSTGDSFPAQVAAMLE